MPTTNLGGCDFHKDGNAIGYAYTSSPYVEAWKFDLGSGFGTKYADPSSLPGVSCRQLKFSNTGRYVGVGVSSGTTVFAYDWTYESGFGTRYSASLNANSSACDLVCWNSTDTLILFGSGAGGNSQLSCGLRIFVILLESLLSSEFQHEERAQPLLLWVDICL